MDPIFSIALAVIGLLIFGAYILSGFTVVQEWERRPVLHLGKYQRTLGPGVRWIEPFTNRVLPAVDTRQETLTFKMDEGQSLQTHDNVPISFVTVLTTQIDDVQTYTLGVRDGKNAVKLRTLSTVSEAVSGAELNELLHRRDKVCSTVLDLLTSRLTPWGVKVVAVEFRDVRITDVSIQEAIALKARAAKEAEAEFVRAEAQVSIAKELNLAANELTGPGWELKRIETMLELCRSAENNTILVPADALAGLSMFAAKVVPPSVR